MRAYVLLAAWAILAGASCKGEPERATPLPSATAVPVAVSAKDAATGSPPPSADDTWPDVPKLLPVPALDVAVRPTTPEACKNRRLASLGTSKLAALVSRGDACAASTLASTSIRNRPFPDAWQRALRFAMLALDAGAATGCELFEMARDFERLAKCFERNHDLGALALAYATGTGVPRDVARARSLAAKAGGSVSGIVDAEAREPSGAPRPFCRDAPLTTLDIEACLATRIVRADYASAAGRSAAFHSLDANGKQAFSKLNEALVAYADAEARRAVMNYACGTMRGAQGLGRDLATREAFDQLLVRAVTKRDLPAASEDEVARIKERVRAAEAEQRSSIGSCSEAGVAPWRAQQKAARIGSARAHAAYEKAFVALVAALGAADGEQRIRLALARQRLEALRDRGD